MLSLWSEAWSRQRPAAILNRYFSIVTEEKKKAHAEKVGGMGL
jgi:hypothetical protein